MVVGFYGIHGTYNFGCEAIVRGARQFVHDLYPHAHVIYYSYSYEYDVEALNDIDIEVINLPHNKSLWKRIMNKVLSLLGINQRILMFDCKKILSKSDIIFSIGGDIYTIPEVERKKTKYSYYNSLVDLCNRCNKPIVLYGASVGPWGRYKKAVSYYVNNMRRYKAIICRENQSINYLSKLKFDNIVFSPDPAFLLGKQNGLSEGYIGINISPLSLNEVYGGHEGVHVKRMSNLLDSIIERFDRDLLFLPHVISNNINDNDKIFLENVKSFMRHKNRVIVAETSGGFLGLKTYIQKCHIVISARMHCAINAIEENVPAVLLSYSRKSIGMCEYIYGSKKWVVQLDKMELELPERIQQIIDSRDELVDYLKKRNAEIRVDYNDSLSSIMEMMNRKK